MIDLSETPLSFDDLTGDAAKHLARLISFDTVSCNSNRALIDHMADYFGDLGGRITILPDETGAKANLIAAFGPEDKAGIVWSGHTDVVPAMSRSGKRTLFRPRSRTTSFLVAALAT